jgi:hypothetical protein
MTQEVGSQKRKVQMQIWAQNKPWCTQIEDWVLSGSADKVTGIHLEEKMVTLT